MKMTLLKSASLIVFLSSPMGFASSSGGVVIGWGHNAVYGSTDVAFSPLSSTSAVVIAGNILTNACAISSGGNHGLALTSDGRVAGWGDDTRGETTGFRSGTDHTNGWVELEGQRLGGVSAIAVGTAHSIALKENGTVIGWGDNQAGQAVPPPGLTNVMAIVAGASHSLALKRDGTIIGWGRTALPPRGLSNVIAISATCSPYGNDLALKADGTIVEWSVGNGELNLPPVSNVVAIAAGPGHSLALKRDGTVFGWGNNGQGQSTGVPTTRSPYVESGPVMINGHTLRNVVAIATGGSPFPPPTEFSLALKSDGSVVAWGSNLFHQTDVPVGLTNVVAISAGPNFCLAITTNRTVAERFRH